MHIAMSMWSSMDDGPGAAHTGYKALARQTFKLLLDLSTTEVKLDTGPSSDWTTLMRAAASGNLELVKLLVKQGADLNAMSPQGVTAAMLAAKFGNLPVLMYLSARGARMRYVSWTGRTVLGEAIRGDHVDVVTWLMAFHKVQVTKVYKPKKSDRKPGVKYTEQTPLETAVRLFKTKCLKTMLKLQDEIAAAAPEETTAAPAPPSQTLQPTTSSAQPADAETTTADATSTTLATFASVESPDKLAHQELASKRAVKHLFCARATLTARAC